MLARLKRTVKDERKRWQGKRLRKLRPDGMKERERVGDLCVWQSPLPVARVIHLSDRSVGRLALL